MSTAKIGKVVQCIGAVVDVEFPRDQMPNVFEALIIDDALCRVIGVQRGCREHGFRTIITYGSNEISI